MLKVLRDSMKYLAWILWAVIAVFVLFVFVDFGSSVPQPGSPTRAAATVGDRDVSYRAFEREYRQLEEQLRNQLGAQYTPELAEQLRLPLQALDRVITREILLAEAHRLGLAVSDEEVRETILSYPAFKDQTGRFVGEQTYDRTLRSVGYDAASFEDAIREQLLVDRVRSALRSSVVVSPQQVEERFREQTERARIRYLRLPFAALRGEVEAGEEELARYFAEHRESYRLPEERLARYLLVDQRRLREGLEPSDEEIRRYYETHGEELARQEQVRARHVLVSTAERSREEATARLEEARLRLEAGEEFAAVARELSDDPGSAARGGDLGWFARGRMVAPFEEAAFAATPGVLVGPVETQFGLHLLEVVDRQAAGTPPLEEVRELAASRVAAERAESDGEALARRLAAELGERPAASAFERLAAEHPAVESGETAPFLAQGPISPLGSAPALNQAAFALAEGALSQPLRTPRGWVVLQVTEVHEPRLPSLDDVSEPVRRDLVAEKAGELAVSRLAAARRRLEAGAELAAVATELGLTVEESPQFGPQGPIGGLGANREISSAALGLEVGALGGPVRHDESAVLFEVAERTTFDAAELERRRQDITLELEQEQVDALFAALVQQRRRELGVSYDRQLLEAWDLMGEGPAEG